MPLFVLARFAVTWVCYAYLDQGDGMKISGPAPSAPLHKLYITELQDGNIVTTYFVCTDKQLLTSAQGKPYLRLKLRDVTGELAAVMFDGAAEAADSFARGDVVKVEGQYSIDERYGPQLKVRRMRPMAPNEYDKSALVPVSPVDQAVLAERLRTLVKSVQQPNLRALLERATDASREPGASFHIAPAAVKNHHAYLRGLLEHSLVVAEVAAAVAYNFANVNRDLVVCGGLLHDIGKSRSYSLDLMQPGLTDEGRLQGEIVLGHQLVAGLIAQDSTFPAPLAQHLLHIILAHHGMKEKGSPVVPATREAVIVHYCDDMTAQISAIDFAEHAAQPGERWAFSHMLDSMVFLPAADSDEDHS
jgi:3'-5' exoribonuclease